MATIIERPYNCSWSKNDIRYVFQLDNLLRPNLQLQVKLLWSVTSEFTGFTELTTFLLKPDTKGYIYLYIQAYLDSLLEYVLPNIDSNAIDTVADAQSCMFTLHFRELSDDVPTPDYDTTEEEYNTSTRRLFCIKGGIEKHKHSRNNYFQYFIGSKPFLTWQPSNRMIDKNEIIYLTFLNPFFTQTNFYTAFSVQLDYTDIEGATGTKIIDFTNTDALLFHLAIKVNEIDLSPILYSKLYAMKVTVLVAGAKTPLTFINYYFEYRPLYSFYDLIYHNSLGGVDFVRVKGEVSESVDRATEDAIGGFDVNDWNAPVKKGEAIYSSLSLQRKYKGDIGYLREKTRQFAFLEILISLSIFQRINFRWVQLITLQKSQDLGAKRSQLNSFPIEWALSESNEVFTPMDFYLSAGDTSLYIACVPVSSGVGTSLPGGQIGVAYQGQIVLAGTQPFTLSNIVKPSWMTLTLAGDSVLATGTPDVVTNNAVVAFDATNCSPVPYHFSYSTYVIAAACTPVSIPSFSLPDATVGQAYSYSVALSGTAPFTVTTSVYPSWMTIAIQGSNLVFSGTPTTTTGDPNVDGTVHNPCGSAIFAKTITVTAVIETDYVLLPIQVAQKSLQMGCFKANNTNVLVTMPFTSVISVRVETTLQDGSDDRYDTYTNITFAQGDTQVFVVNYPGGERKIIGGILESANPENDGTNFIINVP